MTERRAIRRGWGRLGILLEPTAVPVGQDCCGGSDLTVQRTLREEVRAAGVGLHSGERIQLALRGAGPDAGIVFRRTDLGPRATVKAAVDNVIDTQFATTLANGEVRVSTVEHLMATLAGFGIDNAEVDVSGPEVPIMDGSAAPFVQLIERAGVARQRAPKRYLRILGEVAYAEGCAVARLKPHAGFRVDYTMRYDHPFLRRQTPRAALEVTTETFVGEISPARTFGLLEDMEELRARNLIRGGSLENAIVVDDEGILNPEGLRHPDEFVRHKVLDAIGDLYMCGYALQGAFVGRQSGHGINHGLLRRLLATPSAYRIVTSPLPARRSRPLRADPLPAAANGYAVGT